LLVLMLSVWDVLGSNLVSEIIFRDCCFVAFRGTCRQIPLSSTFVSSFYHFYLSCILLLTPKTCAINKTLNNPRNKRL